MALPSVVVAALASRPIMVLAMVFGIDVAKS